LPACSSEIRPEAADQATYAPRMARSIPPSTQYDLDTEGSERYQTRPFQARSSVVEHYLDTVGVGSSILPVPSASGLEALLPSALAARFQTSIVRRARSFVGSGLGWSRWRVRPLAMMACRVVRCGRTTS